MTIDLFAGVPVTDLARAIEWFDGLLGDVAWFDPNDTERVWTVNDHAYVYAVLEPAAAGHARVTLFVDDLERFLQEAGRRGVAPDSEETYENGVRKCLFHDPDGNEIGIGGGPS